MLITALGHAGLKIQAADSVILIDPWFAPEGAFQASWFPFPDNIGLLADTTTTRPNAVIISHEHLDHLDTWFLARLPADVPVYVPRYPSRVLRRKLATTGERPIIEVVEWQEVEIAPGVFLFFVSEPPMNHDSAVIVQSGGHTLLNLNDARLFPIQLREICLKVGGTVDVLSFQGAGASWFPICYEYSSERRRELSTQKRNAKLNYCNRIMKAVRPTVGIPFAGPPAFLDPALVQHNAEMIEGIFPDQQQVVDWLTTRGVINTALLLPGDTWDIQAGKCAANPEWKGFRFEDRFDYLHDYAMRRRPHIDAVLARHPAPTEDLWPSFANYFGEVLELSGYFNERINMRVGFEIVGPGGGAWAIDFRPGHKGVLQELEDTAYRYRIESRWLLPLLLRTSPWEDFLLSLRFTAKRNPDHYNDHLLGLLKFAEAEALDRVEQFEQTMATDDRIEISYEGRTYRIQRQCPHAGNDLANTGELLPGGILRCLAHHYEFDLATGVCLNSVCPPLQVEIAEPSLDNYCN